MNNPAKSARPTQEASAANAVNNQQIIEKFFGTWAPFAQLPDDSPVRSQVNSFVAANTPEERRASLEKANLGARLLRAYADAGVLRPDQTNGFADALGLSREKLAQSIRAGTMLEPLGTLQKAFAFGRFPAVPNQQAATTFLLEFFALHIGGPSMKYCTYAKALPFSAGGKTHEEMARVFVTAGYGSGNPVGGGQLARRGKLDFEYDVTCTAFRGGMRPEEVKAGIQRWIRTTGGDEAKVNLKFVPAVG